MGKEKVKLYIIKNNNITEIVTAEKEDNVIEYNNKSFLIGNARPLFVQNKLLFFNTTVTAVYYVRENNANVVDVSAFYPVIVKPGENPKDKIYIEYSPEMFKSALAVRFRGAFTELRQIMLFIIIGLIMNLLCCIAIGYKLFMV